MCNDFDEIVHAEEQDEGSLFFKSNLYVSSLQLMSAIINRGRIRGWFRNVEEIPNSPRVDDFIMGVKYGNC